MKYSAILLLAATLLNNTSFSQQVSPGSNTPVAVTNPPVLTTLPAIKNIAGYTNRNYVRVFLPRYPLTTPHTISITNTSLNIGIKTQYFDGIGRPIQTVERYGLGNNDIVQPFLYDNIYGVEKYKFLPYGYLLFSNRGKFRNNVASELQAFYNYKYPGDQPYSQNEIDGSILCEVTKTLPQGRTWVGSSKGSTVTRRSNMAAAKDKIALFYINNGNINDLPVLNTYYPDDYLNIVENMDEDGNRLINYYDRLGGKLIAVRKPDMENLSGVSQADLHKKLHITYYVYDYFDRLRFVIPPQAYKNIYDNATPNFSNTIADELCYKYFYDKKGRLVEKKLPGKAVEYFVYDKRDRLVMRQDGNLRAGNNWHCYVYDALNRVLGEAIYYNTSTRASWESYFQSTTTATVTYSMLYYLTNYNLVRNPFSLTDQPNDATLIKRIYYDDYNYPDFSTYSYVPALNSTLPGPTLSEAQPSAHSLRTKNLVTASADRVQEADGTWSSSWGLSVNFYNDKGQVIQTNSRNHDNSTDIVCKRYYFTGDVASTLVKHVRNGQTTTVVKQYLKNAHTNRLEKITQSINNGATVPISASYYDEWGRLVQKMLGTNFNNNYTYNIRNWLTGINPNYVDNGYFTPGYGPYFGEKLSYDKGFASKLYNGNIAGIQWRKSTGAPKEFYGYAYDKGSRLSHAEYGKWEAPSAGATPTWTKNHTDFTASNITYDVNGNLLTMDQRGPTHTSSSNGAIVPGDMDQLVYDYFPNSNKLKAVYDNATGVHINGNPDFENDLYGAAQDYDYDANGNLKQDINKGISNYITYSLHNKPLAIWFDDGSRIEYTYDASGNKLRKVITTAQTNTTETWDYGNNGFVYKNDALQYILHEEGRCRPIPSEAHGAVPDFTYDFFIKDHLNNVRTVVGTNTIYVSNWDQVNADHYIQLARTYRATMEVANAGVESAVWEYLSEVSDVNPYPAAPDDAKAARLNGGEPDRQIGTALMLQVMPGDRIDVSGYNYYNMDEEEGDSEGSSNTSIADMLMTALSNGVNVDGIPVNELPQNMAILQSTIGGSGFTTLLDELDNELNDPNLPASNLVWVYFDKDMNAVREYSGSLQAAGENEWALAESGTIEVGDAGYLLIFTKNKLPKSVWWNELKVKVQQGAILEEDHYYPFGLTLSQASANPNEKNDIKYNSKELQSELGLHWYNYGARQYDMQTGRWTGIDLLADKYYSISPFAYVANNPVIFVDPDGKVIRLNSETSNSVLLNSLNSFVGQQDIFKASYLGTMQFLTVREADLSNMSSQQRAFYTLMRTMSGSEKVYHVNLAESGNDGDPFYADDYASGTLYSENLENTAGSKYWTKATSLYHYFSEQKYKQDGNHDDYIADHNATLKDQSSAFGYKFTKGFTTKDGNTTDVDVLDTDNRYMGTIRSTKTSDGSYKISDFNRSGVKVGDKIDPNWQNGVEGESYSEFLIIQDDYFNQNR